MDATIMPSTHSILSQLKANYPHLTFSEGEEFSWSPSDETVYYRKKSTNKNLFLLHEISHALLGHAGYSRDVQLIAMERQAWDHAKILGKAYSITIPADFIQSTLDSYRDWLHARSTCPNCEATGVQIKKNGYSCPACSHRWRVNEARICALRRYSNET